MSNLLKNEKSPYLKQHENNPVHWYPWGESSLKKAKELNVTIINENEFLKMINSN